MPLLETKGAASAQGFGGAGAGASGPVTYIEDVFSTYLYTGNGSIQTINNGIDLAGKGGLVWVKARNAAENNALWAYNLFGDQYLKSNTTDAIVSSGLTYLSNGFRADAGFAYLNASSTTYTSWAFREQPKFFDIVTYTGNGANRTISHNLGSVPGCIIVKRTDAAADWQVYHRSNANTQYMVLNSSAGVATGTTRWNSTTPTSTVFSLGTDTTVNASGGTYVAYLFAHNAGGFGLTGTDNVISCESYTGNGSATGPTITLGYEPQWLMVKSSSSGIGSWIIYDIMRGLTADGTNDAQLYPNAADAEYNSGSTPLMGINATGFQPKTSYSAINASGETYIYIAIRRGPMKVPTSGTSVYTPTARTGTGTQVSITSAGFPPDLMLSKDYVTANSRYFYWADRLRGPNTNLYSNSSGAEYGPSVASNTVLSFDQLGVTLGTDSTLAGFNFNSGEIYSQHYFRRAPSFFDEVCYTGTGSNTTINHNLGVAPELIIGKTRSVSSDWPVFTDFSVSAYKRLYLSLTNAAQNADYTSGFGISSRSATTLGLQTISGINQSGQTQVLYLFATCPGVSKVGSYTGTGALQTVNCGFTGGARFVLIKRTDSTGDWYVYDSARGISSSSDPYLFLNSVAAQVTGTNYVDTTSVGFQVTAAAPAGINANGGTYIFLAIA